MGTALLGSLERQQQVGFGYFFCPYEGMDHHFRRQRVGRWIGLRGRALVRYRTVTDVVECQGCGHRYDPAILSGPKAIEERAALHAGIRRVVVALLPSVGPIEVEEWIAALQVIRGVIGPEYTSRDLERDRETLRAGDATAALRYAAPRVSRAVRQNIIAALHELADADGHPTPRQRAVLDAAARALAVGGLGRTGALDSRDLVPGRVPESLVWGPQRTYF